MNLDLKNKRVAFFHSAMFTFCAKILACSLKNISLCTSICRGLYYYHFLSISTLVVLLVLHSHRKVPVLGKMEHPEQLMIDV